MSNQFGPWATLIDAGGNPQLTRLLAAAADDARAHQPNQPDAPCAAIGSGSSRQPC